VDVVDKDLKPHKLHMTSAPVRSDSPQWRAPIKFKAVPPPRKYSFADEEKTPVVEEVEGIINQVKDRHMKMGGIEVAESADGYLITVEAGTNIVLAEQVWWHKFVPKFLHNKIDHLLIVMVVALVAVFIYVFNVNRETSPVDVIETVSESAKLVEKGPDAPSLPPRKEAAKVDPSVRQCVDSLVTRISLMEVKSPPLVSVDETGDVRVHTTMAVSDEYGDKQSSKRKANKARADIKSGVSLLREEEEKTSKARVKNTVERTASQKSRTDRMRDDDREGPVVQKSSFVFYQQEDIIKHLERHGDEPLFRGVVMYNKLTKEKRHVKTKEEMEAARREGFQIAPWLLPDEVAYVKIPLEKFDGKFPPIVVSILAKLGYVLRQEDQVEDTKLLRALSSNIILSKEELATVSSVAEKLSGDSAETLSALVKRSNKYWTDDKSSPTHDFGSHYAYTNTRAAVVHSVKHPSDIVRAIGGLKRKSDARPVNDESKGVDEVKTNSTCTLKSSGFCKSEYCRVDHQTDGCLLDNGVWRRITVLARPVDAPVVKPESVGKSKSKVKKKQAGSDPAVLRSLVDEATSATIRSNDCPFDPCTIKNCVKQHKKVEVADERKKGVVLDVDPSVTAADLAVLNESNISGSVDNTRSNGVFTLYCKQHKAADRRTDAIGQCWMGPHRLETVAHNFWDTNGVPRSLEFSDYYILSGNVIHYVVKGSVVRYKLGNTDLVDDYAAFEVDPAFMQELHSTVRYSLASPRLGGSFTMVVAHATRGIITLPVEVVSVDNRFLMQYSTDTEAGYSGAPIIERSSGKVVGRHKGAIPNSKRNCALGHNTSIIAMCGTVSTQMAAMLPKN